MYQTPTMIRMDTSDMVKAGIKKEAPIMAAPPASGIQDFWRMP